MNFGYFSDIKITLLTEVYGEKTIPLKTLLVTTNSRKTNHKPLTLATNKVIDYCFGIIENP